MTVAADEVEEGATLVVTARTPGDDLDEVVLTRSEGEIRAYVNRCQHWTDVRLDGGDGAYVRSDEIVCERHGAMFRVSDGLCTFGPCEGAYLPAVEVEVEGGAVELAGGYQLVERGPLEDDDGGDLGTRGGDDF